MDGPVPRIAPHIRHLQQLKYMVGLIRPKGFHERGRAELESGLRRLLRAPLPLDVVLRVLGRLTVVPVLVPRVLSLVVDWLEGQLDNAVLLVRLWLGGRVRWAQADISVRNPSQMDQPRNAQSRGRQIG